MVQMFDIEVLKGKFPLKEAVHYNRPFMVRKLLDNGAHVNDVDDNGETCLHIPLVNIESLDLIFCYGELSIFNKEDNNGKTILIVATEHINRDVISFLYLEEI